jgi:hypothetical protein
MFLQGSWVDLQGQLRQSLSFSHYFLKYSFYEYEYTQPLGTKICGSFGYFILFILFYSFYFIHFILFILFYSFYDYE